jgi:hypothetical protein
VAPFFRGFKNSPVYSISFAENNLFSAVIQDSVISVNAKDLGGIGMMTMQVMDSEGTTFQQRLSIAVTGDKLGIPSVWNEDDIEVVGREFFTLDGKKVNHLESQEVYIMKVYDAKGQTHTMKIIKD